MSHKRLISLLLTAILLASVMLVACDKPNDDTTETTASDGTASGEPETTADIYDENGYIKDNIPEDLDYKDETVNILAWEEQIQRTLSEVETGDRISDALFYRLRDTEDRLGVKLNFQTTKGNWNNRNAFISKVENSVNAGTGDYDLIMAYNLVPPTLAVNGLVIDLNETKYLDFTNEWWPQNLVSTASVDGHLYFAVDNSSWNSIRNMACIIFNKQLVADYNITPEQLYTMVFNGEWTIDKLAELTEGMYADLNSSGLKDYGDQFGFANDTAPRLDAFFYANDLTIIGKNDSGEPEFKLGDEKIQTVLEKMVSLFNSNQNVWLTDKSQYSMFKNNQAVFYETAIAIVDQKLELDFGILPIPKWDTAQESYITYMSNTHDAWCAPVGVADADRSSAVVECLASEAYRLVAPEYFEITLKVKYSSDEMSAKIYDTIRAGVIFDFGYIYGNSFSNAPFLLFRGCITSGSTDWASTYGQYKSSYDKELTAILKALKEKN